MKKIIIAIIFALLTNNICFADSINNTNSIHQGITSYKKGNYVSSASIMEKIIYDDPANILAHYYLAISYVQLGKNAEAINQYNNVITLNPNSELAEFAQKGLKQLEGVPDNSKQITLPSPLIDNQIPVIQNNFPKKSFNDQPTQEEIAQAMQVLSKAGINNYMNPESMKMNALMNTLNSFGNNNNNNNMNGFGMNSNMLPFMLMMQSQNLANQGSNPMISEELLNTMMMPNMLNTMGMGN